jgi:ParB family chromosome partitioning protein
MEQTGQITPIEVAPGVGNTLQLVAGAHRLAAAQLLGWETIEAVQTDGSADELRLREIDENLYRHELNPLDQAVFLAERQAIYERLHPETKHGSWDRKGKDANSASLPKPKSFAEDVSSRIGLAKRTIQLALQRHQGIAPEALELVRGTWIARKGSALDQLRDVPRQSQVEVARALLSDAVDRPRTVRDARRIVLREEVPTPPDLVKRAFGQVEKLSVEERIELVEMMVNRGWCAKPRRAA